MYANKLYNLDEMEKFLEKQTVSKQTEKIIDNLNSLITSKVTVLLIIILHTKRTTVLHGLNSEFFQIVKKK